MSLIKRAAEQKAQAPAPARRRRAAAAGYEVPATTAKGLSAAQTKALAMHARRAFEFQKDHGNLHSSETFDAFRHAACMEAVQRKGLRDCHNKHFRPLKAHFLMLAGKDDQAFTQHLKSGKVKDHGALEDTHENREELRALITKTLTDHALRCDPAHASYAATTAATVAAKGGTITGAYAATIAKNKFKGLSAGSLTTAQLWQLLYTMKNRIAAREGRGETRQRNKSQRRR